MTIWALRTKLTTMFSKHFEFGMRKYSPTRFIETAVERDFNEFKLIGDLFPDLPSFVM